MDMSAPLRSEVPRPNLELRWLDDHRMDFPYTLWHGLDRIRVGAEFSVVRYKVEQALTTASDEVVTLSGPSGIEGLTVVRPKLMESDLLGIPTAEIGDLLIPLEAPQRMELLIGLIRSAKVAAHDMGAKLVVMRVDSNDPTALWAAQKTGFITCEVMTAFLIDQQMSPGYPETNVVVEIHEGDVSGLIDQEDVNRLKDAIGGWRLSHLSADPGIPEERVSAYYRTWIDNIVDGSWCDAMAIARLDGEFVGIQTFVHKDDIFAATEIGILEIGWTTSLKPGHRVGQSMIKATGSWRHSRGPYQWWDTQSRNLVSTNGIISLEFPRIARSSYTLHAWRD